MNKIIILLNVIVLVILMFVSFCIGYSVGKSKPFNQYEVLVGNYSNIIMDGDRYVGEIPVDTCSTFDSLIMKDNE